MCRWHEIEETATLLETAVIQLINFEWMWFVQLYTTGRQFIQLLLCCRHRCHCCCCAHFLYLALFRDYMIHKYIFQWCSFDLSLYILRRDCIPLRFTICWYYTNVFLLLQFEIKCCSSYIFFLIIRSFLCYSSSFFAPFSKATEATVKLIMDCSMVAR